MIVGVWDPLCKMSQIVHQHLIQHLNINIKKCFLIKYLTSYFWLGHIPKSAKCKIRILARNVSHQHHVTNIPRFKTILSSASIGLSWPEVQPIRDLLPRVNINKYALFFFISQPIPKRR